LHFILQTQYFSVYSTSLGPSARLRHCLWNCDAQDVSVCSTSVLSFEIYQTQPFLPTVSPAHLS
ncbi:hypothetical protein M9458_023848, partial [Cirrhinus mrigala]